MRVETGKLEPKPKPTGVSSALQPGKKQGGRPGRGPKKGSRQSGDASGSRAGQKADSGSDSDPEELEEAGDGSDSDPDADICHICAEKVKYYAITQCNNVSCHKCPLRRAALYQSNKCEFCRSEHDYVVIASTSDKRFEEYNPVIDIKATSKAYHMGFESTAIEKDTLSLLKQTCPVCHVTLNNDAHFKDHVRDAHHKGVCNLCFSHKKQFPVERRLYSGKQLTDHNRKGLEREQREKGFTGHPECKFCQERFYDGDHLFKHMRDKHEKCHMCEKQQRGQAEAQPRYFRDYDHLFSHFKEDHYVCSVQSCLDAKFVAFDNDIDLKAHQLEQHPSLYGSSRSARNIEISFGDRESSRPGNRRRGFGGELSTIRQQEPVQQQQNNRQQQQAPVVVERSGPAFSVSDFPELGGANQNGPGFSAVGRNGKRPVARGALAGPPPASASHDNPAAVLQRRINERARNYLGYSMAKFDEFDEMTHKFLKYQIDAKKLVFGYSTLFEGVSLGDMTLLVEEVAQQVQNANVKHKLTLAWEEHRASKQQKKVLVGKAKNKPMINSAWSASGGRSGGKIDSRSSNAFPSLGGASSSSGASSSFPALGGSKSAPVSAKSSSTNLSGRMNGLTITTSASGRSSGTSSPSWGNSSSSKAPKKVVRNESDFPAFPTAPPKKYGRVNPVVPPGQWGASSLQDPLEPEDPNAIKMKRKGKKIVLDLGL